MPARKNNDLLIKASPQQQDEARRLVNTAPLRLRAGMPCPRCASSRLDYNGLLQLTCPQCGVIESGAFT